MTIEPSWVVAGVAILVAAILGIWLWATRRRQVSISDSAGELAELHRAGARERRDSAYLAAVAAGERAVAEADAVAEREVSDAGDFAGHMHDLDSGAK